MLKYVFIFKIMYAIKIGSSDNFRALVVTIVLFPGH